MGEPGVNVCRGKDMGVHPLQLPPSSLRTTIFPLQLPPNPNQLFFFFFKIQRPILFLHFVFLTHNHCKPQTKHHVLTCILYPLPLPISWAQAQKDVSMACEDLDDLDDETNISFSINCTSNQTAETQCV